jgi:hypothetical protein
VLGGDGPAPAAGDPARRAAHRPGLAATAEEIRSESSQRGVDDRGVFRQHYETDALDASTLLIPLVRFLPATTSACRATVLAIADELTEHGLVLRYRTDETDDGLHGHEGTFLICSFWMVSALSEIGERARPARLCEKLLSAGSPLSLYAEELRADSGRHLGNFPQALTHLGLIKRRVARDRRRAARPLGWPGAPGSHHGGKATWVTSRTSKRSTTRSASCSRACAMTRSCFPSSRRPTRSSATSSPSRSPRSR